MRYIFLEMNDTEILKQCIEFARKEIKKNPNTEINKLSLKELDRVENILNNCF